MSLPPFSTVFIVRSVSKEQYKYKMPTLVNFEIIVPKSKWDFGPLDHICPILVGCFAPKMESETKLSIHCMLVRSQLCSDSVRLS